jgi:N-acetylated-alpha-linked acidic dipeptidase
VSLVVSHVVSLLYSQPPPPRGLTGFSDAAAADQFTREKQFDASLNRGDLQTWLQRLSAKPHHLGSPADKENAEFIAARLYIGQSALAFAG